MAVTVDPKSKKLVIRFRVSGYPRQFYLSSGLKDNKSNRAIVDSRWEFIQREISLNEFDSSLKRYRFGVKKISSPKERKYTLSELWAKFTNFHEQTLAASTIHNYAFTGRIIAKIPAFAGVEVRNYLLENYSYHTARKIISDLRRCHDWAINENLVTENPFQSLTLSKPKKSSSEKIAAYTLEERDLIISTFENHPKFSHYASLIKFLFWTGCRPGESFALTWGDVSADCSKITISKSYASAVRLTKGTKNGKRRIFPCPVGGKLQTLLTEMRSHQPNTDELLFRSPTGKQLTLQILEKVWRGNQTREYFYPGVVKELADKCLIPYLKLYSTRHTFATWAIATGSTPEKVAYWLGDHVLTVMFYYCHPEVSKTDCPDF